MKKNITAFVFALVSIFGYCQNHENDRITDVLNEYALNKQLKYEPSKTLGSPYLNKLFAPAVVSGVSKNAMMRYDAFSDEFEFVNSSKDTLVFNKVEPYNTITFTITNTKYKLVDYDKKGKTVTGYLIWLCEKNDFTLFKKQNVVYTDEKIATTSFDRNLPAKFDREKDSFYFKNKNQGIIEFPTSKKGLLKLFPDKKDALEAFIKENNIDFKNEADLIRVAGFLAG